MGEREAREGRSVAETPTWAVATVITVMVAFGFFFHSSLKRCGKVKEQKKTNSHREICLDVLQASLFTLSNSGWIKLRESLCLLPWRRSRKVSSWVFRDGFLFDCFNISSSFWNFGCCLQAELMLFGLLSLLMGHWIVYVAKICVKSSVLGSRFYPCASEVVLRSAQHILVSSSGYLNSSFVREQMKNGLHNHCPQVVSSLPF